MPGMSWSRRHWRRRNQGKRRRALELLRHPQAAWPKRSAGVAGVVAGAIAGAAEAVGRRQQKRRRRRVCRVRVDQDHRHPRGRRDFVRGPRDPCPRFGAQGQLFGAQGKRGWGRAKLPRRLPSKLRVNRAGRKLNSRHQRRANAPMSPRRLRRGRVVRLGSPQVVRLRWPPAARGPATPAWPRGLRIWNRRCGGCWPVRWLHWRTPTRPRPGRGCCCCRIPIR